MTGTIIGLFGGAAASLMGSLVFAFDESTPFPLSVVAARALGGDATEYYRLGFLSTFLYGLPLGAAYVYVFSRAPLISVNSPLGGLIYGTVWGALITALLLLLVGGRPNEGYSQRILVAHLMYGLVLAGFVVLGPTDPTATPGPAGGF